MNDVSCCTHKKHHTHTQTEHLNDTFTITKEAKADGDSESVVTSFQAVAIHIDDGSDAIGECNVAGDEAIVRGPGPATMMRTHTHTRAVQRGSGRQVRTNDENRGKTHDC